MNKNKILVLSLLTVFVIGMTLATVGAVDAKTVTMPTKYNKYCTKHVGKYKIQTYKWKAYAYQEVDVFLYKKGKMVKRSKYKSKVYYKQKGKKKSTKWSHGYCDSTYHKYQADKSLKLTKVKVKF